MAELTEEQRNQIIEALQQRGASRECPRCGNNSFSLAGGYFLHVLQTNLAGMMLGGPSIPTAVVVCNRCGWLAEHALGSLNLLPVGGSSPAPGPEARKPGDGAP